MSTSQVTVADGGPAGVTDRRKPGSSRLRWLTGSSVGRNLGLVLALALLCAVGVATAGDRFADVDNAMTILRLASVIGVVSVGMTFVITGGGIDLSVGAIVALASVWATTLATQTMATDTHWIVMVGCALAVGTVCGLINGLLVAYGRVVPFIATLAMLAGARGLAEILADRRTQIITIPEFTDFFGRDVLGVPMLVIIFALVATAGWIVLNRTTFGRRTFAVGGNPEAARLAGVNVKRVITSVYVLGGACAGLAGVIFAARVVSAQPTAGTGYELDAIAAVVLGGTSLMGGRGRIYGTLIGAIILGVLSTGLILMNVPFFTQLLIKGAVIILAVAIDSLKQRPLRLRRTATPPRSAAPSSP